jgi:hypothetical protein
MLRSWEQWQRYEVEFIWTVAASRTVGVKYLLNEAEAEILLHVLSRSRVLSMSCSIHRCRSRCQDRWMAASRDPPQRLPPCGSNLTYPEKMEWSSRLRLIHERNPEVHLRSRCLETM